MIMALLMKSKENLPGRHFLKSVALLPYVREARWYTMYREGLDGDLILVTSPTRNGFDLGDKSRVP